MAYQNVGTPRFYTNDLLLGHSLGLELPSPHEENEPSDLNWITNPSNINHLADFGVGITTANSNFARPLTTSAGRPNYIALLGHNFGTTGVGLRHTYRTFYNEWNGGNGITQNFINGNFGSIQSDAQYLKPENDGFSICSIGGDNADANTGWYGWTRLQIRKPDDVSITTQEGIPTFGAIFVGRYFDMPNSPDLSLSLTREYDGIKQVKTRGGATLSNATYTSPPKWGDLPAWQIGEGSGTRTGRRVWDLSFRYVSDSDLMGENEMFSSYKDGVSSPDNGSGFSTTLSDSNDFFSQVINKTQGGHLEFIFQPDKSVFQPDQFALARLDMSSFKLTQKANNVYNLKLKIRESW